MIDFAATLGIHSRKIKKICPRGSGARMTRSAICYLFAIDRPWLQSLILSQQLQQPCFVNDPDTQFLRLLEL